MPTFDQSLDKTATVNVIAGLMWAPGLPNAMAVKMPATTAIPHPVVMTIHPEFSPFDFFRRTLATAPSPSKINTSVPMNSPKNGPYIVCGPPCLSKDAIVAFSEYRLQKIWERVYDTQPLKGRPI